MSDPNNNPEPLPSDKPALACGVCGLELTPADIYTSTGLTRFAITEGKCPLCLFNIITRLAPALAAIPPKQETETEEIQK